MSQISKVSRLADAGAPWPWYLWPGPRNSMQKARENMRKPPSKNVKIRRKPWGIKAVYIFLGAISAIPQNPSKLHFSSLLLLGKIFGWNCVSEPSNVGSAVLWCLVVENPGLGQPTGTEGLKETKANPLKIETGPGSHTGAKPPGKAKNLSFPQRMDETRQNFQLIKIKGHDHGSSWADTRVCVLQRQMLGLTGFKPTESMYIPDFLEWF